MQKTTSSETQKEKSWEVSVLAREFFQEAPTKLKIGGKDKIN